jgi:hypothetical protein
MSAPLLRTPKPYFVLLELLTSLKAFIYYTILMLMYKVELKPKVKNNLLFKLRA